MQLPSRHLFDFLPVRPASFPSIFILTLLTFFLGCAGDEPIPSQPAAQSSLRVLTMNVWSGLDYEGTLWMGEYESKTTRERRYQALVRQITDLSPDIVGVQEANKLPDYAERLARDLDFDVHYHVGVGGVRLGKVGLPWNLREGDAILTRPSLHAEFAGRKQLSGGHVGNFSTFHFSDATQVLAVKIRNRGQPVFVFATHWHASVLRTSRVVDRLRRALSSGEIEQQEHDRIVAKMTSGEAWRRSESEQTLAYIKKIAGQHPYILLGDFNAIESSEEIALVRRSGAIDAFRYCNPDSAGYTWAASSNLNIRRYYLDLHQNSNPADFFGALKRLHEATPKRIDFIFVGPDSVLRRQEISIADSKVAMNHVLNGVHSSDHFGVFAELHMSKIGQP